MKIIKSGNMLMKLIVTILSVVFLFLTSKPVFCFIKKPEKPKLILQITVDQLRGDLPFRYEDRFGDGGFKYLMKKGLVYTNAHYQHANTETIVGHAILATGAFPSKSGMVANVWYDLEDGRLVYNIEDSRYTLTGDTRSLSKDEEVDKTQAIAGSDGRSPKTILTSTFSDELFISNNGQSKIFGVSVKDRGAVSLAGHAGKAFWFSKKSGEFISSTYYYDDYPGWVKEWNGKKKADQYQDTSWELFADASDYMFRDSDDRAYETDFPGYGRVFPHPFGNITSKYFYTLLTVSPVGDTLTLDFAKTLIEKEELGQDSVTDYLSVSFSSTDYVGHLFGPASLESEDNMLRLDRTLADLLSYVDKTVGLKNTLIVLAADHGAPEAPEYMAELGMDTGRIVPSKIDQGSMIDALKKQFGVGKELIKLYQHPYIYLDKELIAKKGLKQTEVERVLADAIMKIDGMALAIPSSELRDGNLPDTPMIRQIRRNFHSKRSGDIYLVQEPYWYLYSDESLPLCSIHGSPWKYDTYVPMIFAGKGIKGKKISRLVHPVDIASTLSAVMGIKPPSGACGDVLSEVVTGK